METYWLEQTEADLPAHDDWLSGDEAVFLSRMRFAKRRADWRLGRWTAKRAAAAYLNLPGDPHALRAIEVRPSPCGAPKICVSNDPAPVVISISHRAGIGVCAITTSGVALGCDIELVEPRGGSFIADYFTGEEQELISRQPEADQAWLLALLWSGKESTLKALREGLRLDTRCVAVALEQGTGHLNGAWLPLRTCYAGGETFRGWWRTDRRLVRTLVASRAPRPPLCFKTVLP